MKIRFQNTLYLLAILALLLGACSPQADTAVTTSETALLAAEQPLATTAPVATVPEAEKAAPATEEAQVIQASEDVEAAEVETAALEVATAVTLDTSYDNAVSVALQLLLGTFELADTDLAVTAEQASALLPLWTEFRTVSFGGFGPGASEDQSSDTDAQVDELTEQIQAEMTAEQLAAITDMQITQETMNAIIEEQGITLGVPDGFGTPPEGGQPTEGGEPPEGGPSEGGEPPEGGPPEGGEPPEGGDAPSAPDVLADATFVPPEVIDALIQMLANVSGEEVTLENTAPGGPPSVGDSDINKTGAYEQNGGTVSESGVTYAATQTDESAVYVYGGGSYTLSDATLTKTGDTSSDADSNFYGNNAIVLAEDESTIILSDCSLTADSLGSNGAFAYGEGSSIIMDNCTISTSGDSSRGVDATYGGTVTVSNSEIHTQGAHSAALATDRYEDNDPPAITADNVTATTAGDGSPGIYSTGTFYVTNSNTVATGAEAAAIEGLNSITLVDSDITGYQKWGVFLYQSMSGDSSIGVSTFDMTGGSLTNNSTGPVFMVLNTETIINLEDVDITTSGDVLIRATDASDGDENVNSVWGTQGGDITFTATDQVLAGTVSCNELSSIDMTLLGTSTLSGAVEIEEGGEISLTLADSAVWTAAGDSYVTSLNGITLSGGTPTNIDADSGVVIYYDSATDADGNALTGTYTLASGGTLVQN